ncbi:hypothetical protein G7085_08050 [Tessaracoccus sp. HDW20]|uniref:hypothetical protein n=1 Tax=Tessaracoccus coleopterorum TaxID=2714950 RepID=UPI0018D39756|nr:hypothetical protein [Tessaracoccus coleopterorum]NHB84578.1 hypothetical protein [Tessaracoccus coleopterorum]
MALPTPLAFVVKSRCWRSIVLRFPPVEVGSLSSSMNHFFVLTNCLVRSFVSVDPRGS